VRLSLMTGIFQGWEGLVRRHQTLFRRGGSIVKKANGSSRRGTTGEEGFSTDLALQEGGETKREGRKKKGLRT